MQKYKIFAAIMLIIIFITQIYIIREIHTQYTHIESIAAHNTDQIDHLAGTIYDIRNSLDEMK